jgi:hypothetical protein
LFRLFDDFGRVKKNRFTANAASPPVEVTPAAASIAFAIHTGHMGFVRGHFDRVIGFTLII